MKRPAIIKKYSNRRLYDTQDSHYITLDELARKVRSGVDVEVVDAKSGEDLTRATLAQILMEDRGAARMIPAAVLNHLIRLGDKPLAEFLENYVAAALYVYMQYAHGADADTGYQSLVAGPMTADSPLSRMLTLMSPSGTRTGKGRGPWPPLPWPQAQPHNERNVTGTTATTLRGLADELAEVRRELDELKQVVQERRQSPRRSSSKRRSKTSAKP